MSVYVGVHSYCKQFASTFSFIIKNKHESNYVYVLNIYLNILSCLQYTSNFLINFCIKFICSLIEWKVYHQRFMQMTCIKIILKFLSSIFSLSTYVCCQFLNYIMLFMKNSLIKVHQIFNPIKRWKMLWFMYTNLTSLNIR